MARYTVSPDAERTQTMTFESWHDAVRYAGEHHADNVIGTASHKQGDYHTASWSGTDTYAEAEKLALNGWPKGRELVERMTRSLEVRLISRIVREDVNYDVEGMSFDVARYLDGEPEHWVRMEESTMQADAHRHVKVTFNISASAGISREVMTARGAAVAALTELLEYADHKVELWVSMGLCGHSWYDGPARDFAYFIRLKAYDQPLDMDRVAFALAQPASFRRIGLALIESADVAVQKSLGGSYGIPADVPHEDSGIYIGEALLGNMQWTDPASAEAWVLAELVKQGVVLRDEE